MAYSLEGYQYGPLRMRANWRPAWLVARLVPVPPPRPSVLGEARFPVVGRLGETLVIVVHHPWRGPLQARVALGRFRLVAGDGEVSQVFSYGGELTIEVGERETLCRMVAPAPIVPLQYAPSPVRHEIETDLAAEVEAILARLRARTGLGREAFDRRLNAYEPEELFLASLASVREVLENVPPHLRARRGYQIAGRIVRDLIARAREAGHWRDSQATLAELMSAAASAPDGRPRHVGIIMP